MTPKFSFDIASFDFDAIHQWLTGTYWSQGISKEKIEKGFRNSSVVIGVFLSDKQIGVGRCVTDTTRFAYIADIFVHPSYRGQGIARKMVDELLGHPMVNDADSCYLITKDAHRVYQKAGFEVYPSPERVMVKRKKRESNQAPEPAT